MSTKTIKQRIAVVAVSALTAGLFSVVSAPVANAADITAQGTVAEANLLVAGSVCVATSAAGGAPLALDAAVADATPFETTATGKVLTVPLGGTLNVTVGDTDIVTIDGPLAVTDLLGVAAEPALLSIVNGRTTVTGDATADSIFTVNAVGLGTASMWVGTAAGAVSTIANTITVNIVAACSSTSFSASKSSVSASTDGTLAAAATANVDAAVTAAAGDNIYVLVDGDNAYDQNLTSGTYMVSATNGALVSISQTAGTAPLKGSGSVITDSTDSDGSIMIRVSPASEATGGTTVLTVTHNTVPVTTKTLTFLGEATKINAVATSGTVSTTGNNSTGLIVFTLQDAAGRSVPGDISLDSLTASARTPAITEAKDATINAAVPANVTAAAAAFPAPGTTSGVEGFDCTTVGGTGSTKLTLKHTQAITGASITTTVDALCAGGVATYTVSTDKAVYAIGEIATITITAKDSTGAAVSDATSVGANDIVSFGGGTMVRASLAADLFSGGVRTYKAQATTAGKFNTVVSISGSTTTSATASYTVTGGDSSNADVLKAIVSLIASINKQIQALQKLILKR
jgi:hypothetical protein